MTYMTPEEAVAAIMEKVKLLKPEVADEDVLAFYVERFVRDVLDYCHRDDFPDTLVYTAAEMLTAWAADVDVAANAPLKSLKQNDTEFEFAVSEAPDAASLYERGFGSIRNKLNLYRKLGPRQ